MTKKALIIVDVQNDFCEGGSLAVHGGAHVAKRISEWMESHAADYDVTVATKDWHPDGAGFTDGVYMFPHFSRTPDYQNTWPPHCVEGTEGALFHPNLETYGIDAVFYKGQDDAAYSGFEGRGDLAPGYPAVFDDEWDVENVEHGSLEWYLRRFEVDEVDVVGLALDYCVKATALDAVHHGFTTNVLVNLTAAVDGEHAAEDLTEMAREGIEIKVAG